MDLYAILAELCRLAHKRGVSTDMGYFIIFYNRIHRSINGACSPPYVCSGYKFPYKIVSVLLHAFTCGCTHSCSHAHARTYIELYIYMFALKVLAFCLTSLYSQLWDHVGLVDIKMSTCSWLLGCLLLHRLPVAITSLAVPFALLVVANSRFHLRVYRANLSL